MYHGLLFDMDGVLLDTEELAYQIWKTYLQNQAGYTLSRESYGTLSGMPPEAFDRFLEDRFPAHASDLRHYWGKEMERVAEERNIPVKPGYEELVSFLNAYSGKKAIVSSNGGPWMARYMAYFQFEQIFDLVIRGDMAKHRKPDPELYLLACEKLGLSPSQCLTIEDSASGIQAAVAAGVDVLWLRGISQVPDEIAEKCIGVVDTLSQALQFIQHHI